MAYQKSRPVPLFALLVVPLTLSFGAATVWGDIVNTFAYRGLTGEDLQSILQEAGYRAELTEDSTGDPLIRTGLDGTDVNIWFYNCSDGTCNNIRFTVGLNLTNGTTLERVNEYNEGYIFGTVTMDDENDPWLRLTHNVADGVTAENLEYVVGRYEAALRTFKDHFNFR